MTKYNPLRLCPIRHKSSQEVGIPVTVVSPPLHSNRPSVWAPDEDDNWVRPKFNFVIGKMVLAVITPAQYWNSIKFSVFF